MKQERNNIWKKGMATILLVAMLLTNVFPIGTFALDDLTVDDQVSIEESSEVQTPEMIDSSGQTTDPEEEPVAAEGEDPAVGDTAGQTDPEEVQLPGQGADGEEDPSAEVVDGEGVPADQETDPKEEAVLEQNSDESGDGLDQNNTGTGGEQAQEKVPEEESVRKAAGEEPLRGAVTHTVTFMVGEEVYETISVEDGQQIETLPADPEKDGHRFDGWFIGDNEVTAETPVSADMEVTARFVETRTVTFYDRDADLYATVTVDAGEAIGDKLPAVIDREDYVAYWAIGSIVSGAQGDEIAVASPVTIVTGEFVPTESATTVVPHYEKISYTITFYEEDKETVVAEKAVTVDTSYCLNDIPVVPAKEGYSAKWVYSEGVFDNGVSVSADTAVWAEYEKSAFTVVFMVNDQEYLTNEYNRNDTLKLPADPTLEGKKFAGWFVGETQYTGGENVTSDLTIVAAFTDMYYVRFIVDGEVQQQQYFRELGEAIGTMPQNPFVAGKVFEKWVNQDTGEEVTAATVVSGNIIAEARFRDVTVYNITAEYYYLSDSNTEVVFNTDYLQVEESELPYTIIAPSTTQTDPNQVTGGPLYYPETPTLTIEKDDFTDNAVTVRVKYVKYTATYVYVYLLKNPDGNGYTEIERSDIIQGVLNSYVTPPVRNYNYAVLELAQGATIEQTSGQELNVYYNRKNFQLTYETNGGTYVAGATVP